MDVGCDKGPGTAAVGDWSIFRREDVFCEKTVDRKHGPVPLARCALDFGGGNWCHLLGMRRKHVDFARNAIDRKHGPVPFCAASNLTCVPRYTTIERRRDRGLTAGDEERLITTAASHPPPDRTNRHAHAPAPDRSAAGRCRCRYRYQYRRQKAPDRPYRADRVGRNGPPLDLRRGRRAMGRRAPVCRIGRRGAAANRVDRRRSVPALPRRSARRPPGLDAQGAESNDRPRQPLLDDRPLAAAERRPGRPLPHATRRPVARIYRPVRRRRPVDRPAARSGPGPRRVRHRLDPAGPRRAASAGHRADRRRRPTRLLSRQEPAAGTGAVRRRRRVSRAAGRRDDGHPATHRSGQAVGGRLDRVARRAVSSATADGLRAAHGSQARLADAARGSRFAGSQSRLSHAARRSRRIDGADRARGAISRCHRAAGSPQLFLDGHQSRTNP